MPHGGLRQDDLRGAARLSDRGRLSLSSRKYESVQISVNGSTKILDDGINFTAESAGQSSKKVSFTKLQLNTAVQEAVKNAVHETVAALAKNGWKQP